jgi:hypothetical protein
MSVKGRNLFRVGLAVAFLVGAVLACGPTPAAGAVSVTITSPGNGGTVVLGQAVMIDSTVTAAAGVERVDLTVGGQVVRHDAPPSGTPTTFRVSQPWTPETEGQVTISVVGYDVNGASGQATITLQVVASGGAVPTAAIVPGATAAPTEPTETPPPPVTTEAGCTLNSQYVADVTIPDGTVMSPGAAFVKTWRVRNSGTCDWEAGFQLIFVGGAQMGGPPSVSLPAVAAGTETDISVNLTAPATYGTHKGTWRIRSTDGTAFGTNLTVLIEVPAPVTDTPLPTGVPTAGPTVPVPPTNLQVSIAGDGRVTFTWNDAVGEAKYKYEISFVAGGLGAATTDELPANTTFYDGGILGCGGHGSFTIVALAADSSEIGRDSVDFETPTCSAPYVEQVSYQLSIASGSSNFATVGCPSGSVAVSGGYKTHPDVYVYAHFKQGNGWRAYGRNDAGAEKKLTVYAVCLFNSGGSTTQVDNEEMVSSGGVGDPIVSCPAGSVVTGGGWAAPDGGLHFYNSRKSGNGWQVRAKNTSGAARPIKAYAVCLSGTTGTTLEAGNSGSVPGNATGYVTAACTGDGLAVGGGFAGSVSLIVYNTSPRPSTDDQWIVHAKNTTGTDKPFNVYVVCLSFP